MILPGLIFRVLGIIVYLKNSIATQGGGIEISSMVYLNETWIWETNTTEAVSAIPVSTANSYSPSADPLNETRSLAWIISTHSNVTASNKERISKSPTVSVHRGNDYVYLVVVPVCFLMGSIGNSLTIFTMSTLPFRTLNWSVILMGLAIADTVMLWQISIQKPLVVDIFGLDVLAITDAGCKTFHFVRRAGKIVSSWFVVVICVERFVAICFPLRVKKICTRHNTIAAMIVICFVAFTFSGLSIMNVGLRGSECRPSIATQETRLQSKIMLLVGSTLNGIAPMLILIVLTPIICFSLIRQRRARTEMTSTAEHSDSYMRVSAMLVSIHATYVVLVLPLVIVINVKFVRQFNAVTYNSEIMGGFETFARVCEIINHSINFLLYVGFNSMFRRRLKEMFSRSTSVERNGADMTG